VGNLQLYAGLLQICNYMIGAFIPKNSAKGVLLGKQSAIIASNTSKTESAHMQNQRTQIAIIGAGPAGLMLGCLLDLAGIDNIIVERQSQAYVLARIRAGILEQTTIDLLQETGAGARLKKEGIPHHALIIAHRNICTPIRLPELTGGKFVTAYGQTEVTKDLCDKRAANGSQTLYQAENVTPCDFDTAHPYIHFEKDGVAHKISCELIIGCDGFHGISRQSVPQAAIRTYEKIYPVGWLGLLSETKPVSLEVVYASTPRGFALCSMRSHTRSRYYIQCALDDRVENWSDDAFWDEFRRRLPPNLAEALETGPSIEKSIAPLRSFVAEPLRFGRLLLAGDAAHVVPPTGAKGLNLAASDIYYLHRAIRAYIGDKDEAALTHYSTQALARVWKAERFSWYLTTMTHNLSDNAFDEKIKHAELDYVTSSKIAQHMIAENYVGLPL